MKVTNINSKIVDGYIRASADVIWEQAKKQSLNFFVEAPEKYESAFWADPNAILLAVYLAAWHAGEERIHIDDSFGPILSRFRMVMIAYRHTGTNR